MQGNVRVESSPAGGARFVLTLPVLSDGHELDDDATDEPGEAGVGSNEASARSPPRSSALAVAATGCAIPTQGAPSTIANSKVPFNLMDPHPPTDDDHPAELVVRAGQGVLPQLRATICVPAQRFVAPPAPLIAIIRSLLQGVTSGETAVRTSRPPSRAT